MESDWLGQGEHKLERLQLRAFMFIATLVVSWIQQIVLMMMIHTPNDKMHSLSKIKNGIEDRMVRCFHHRSKPSNLIGVKSK
jgi:hypothetical protein